ncbi:MAG TPA: hypothetical protein VLL97_11595, partial [Acidobacteriota bacterium]|nr:hypothetical protein [Acidobacteriota bacterium]
LAGTDHVLGHELVHAFQFDMTAGLGTMDGAGLPGALQLPLWFIEGQAEYLSLGSIDPHTAMWMRDAVNRDRLPEINRLDRQEYFPYRWGHAFWAYIAGVYGDEIAGNILRAASAAGSAETGISEVLNVDIKQLSQNWHDAIREMYQPVLDATDSVDMFRVAIGRETGFGDMNISPAISPDGDYVAFFSEKGMFSIDLYLVDIAAGRTQRKLTDTAVDPHFDNLHFVRSAGAWNAAGDRIAYANVRRGRPEITIYNRISGREEKLFVVHEVSEISGLSWFPDGASIAFSAMAGGRTDLFRMDLQSGSVRRLTDDSFTVLHPSVSPDGRSIVFSTDRFSSDLETLNFGDIRLGLFDVATGAITPIKAFENGKHIGPQWSADSGSIFFISDRDGISNIYRMHLGSREIRQLTNLQIGVSGITGLSPAFSVAYGAERLAFSAFIGGNYTIHLLEGPEAMAGFSPVESIEGLNVDVLPTLWRSSEEVNRFLGDPISGLADAGNFESKKYSPRLSLNYVAPPSVGIGLSNFGTMVGGGTALYFSDLLGHHNLMTAFQTVATLNRGNFLNSLSVVGAYENRSSIWNWGFIGGQVPYLMESYGQGPGFVDGQPVIINESVRYWEISRQAAMTFARPLSRAQRFEFSGGFQNISYDAEARVLVYSATTGQLIMEQEYSPVVREGIHLATGNAAMVFDTSIFGGTSPIFGQRYRFEVGMAAGTVRFATLLADYRRYFRIAGPLTLAGRMLHYGRYGWDAEDMRMGDLSVGSASLVRGYAPDSFSLDECVINPDQSVSCFAYDRLFGSRLLVGNAELRLPLLGAIGIIPSRGVPPVEIATFYDIGMAWRSLDIMKQLGIPRRPVSSSGASLRFNVFGFFVGQLSYVYSFDRPQRRWGWEFSIVPGF